MSNTENENEYITFSSLLEDKGLNEKPVLEDTLSEINRRLNYSKPTSSMYSYNSDKSTSNKTLEKVLNKKNEIKQENTLLKPMIIHSFDSQSSVQTKSNNENIINNSNKINGNSNTKNDSIQFNNIKSTITNTNGIQNQHKNESSTHESKNKMETSINIPEESNKINNNNDSVDVHSNNDNSNNNNNDNKNDNENENDNDIKNDSSSIIVEISTSNKIGDNNETNEINSPYSTTNAALAAFAINNRLSLNSNRTNSNRISLTSSEGFTYVNSSPDLFYDEPSLNINDMANHQENRIDDSIDHTRNTSMDINIDEMVANSTSKKENVPEKAIVEEVDLSESPNKCKNDVKKEGEEDDEEDEDNLCAICLIETKKPTDIEDIKNKKKNKNKNVDVNNSSNDTVINVDDEDDDEDEDEKVNMDDLECKLHCKHKFHYSCIAQWLERNQVCPICRMEIKKYEIEAIEKRFSISIDVKEEPLHLQAPRYNLTYDFDNISLTTDLVENYFLIKLPCINMKKYLYTRFIIYFLMFLGITLFGLSVIIANLINGDIVYFTTFSIVIILVIYFLLFVVKMIRVARKGRLFIDVIMKYPTGHFEYYQMIVILCLILFAGISNNINGDWNLESTFQNTVIFFSIITIVVCMIEGKIALNILKMESRRIAEEEANRVNAEIRAHALEAEAQEREEFERNYSNLN